MSINITAIAPPLRRLFDECREIRPLLDAERTDIAHGRCKPWKRLEREYCLKEVCHIFALGDVDTTLDAFESELLQYECDVGVCLRDIFG